MKLSKCQDLWLILPLTGISGSFLKVHLICRLWYFLLPCLYTLWRQFGQRVSFKMLHPQGIVATWKRISTKPNLVSVSKLCLIKGVQCNPCFYVPLYDSVPIHFPNFRNKLLSLERERLWLAAWRVCLLFALTRETVSEYLWCEDCLWFEMGA